jgi:hypothetical protein
MPYTTMPWVKQGGVRLPAGDWLVLDSAAWFSWLQTVDAFCYSSAQYPLRLTVRLEKRRHTWYWYGYSKIDAKLHNVYLGARATLTHARLEQACHKLWLHHKEVHSP